jgi:alpha-L-fucosidase
MLQTKPTAGETAWFILDRFGMFIHWGTYAAAARHEWVQNYEKIDNETYQKYFDHFDPDLYDPKAWAKAAREAGMKYFVITTKHHEGFCLWDSQYTDFKATNTPYGKDLLRPMAEAFRAEGLRVGFYYSLIDWHHPHFPIDIFHPLREHEDAAKMNESRHMPIYAEYMRNQVRELLTDFGPVDILWFDFSYPGGDPKNYPNLNGKGRDDWESEALLKLVRELAPHAIVNNRLDLPDVPADIQTPEQYQPTEWIKVDGEPVVWEACQTLSGSWGYHRDEATWKSSEQLLQMLIDTVSKGGNLLMNVGPTARGVLDGRALGALKTYADWMKLHQRAIYGCTQSGYSAPADARFTQNFEKKRLYVHVFNWPFVHLHLNGLAGKVEYAQFLHDASEVKFKNESHAHEHDNMAVETEEGTLTLELPVLKPNITVPVVELFLK